MRPGSFVGGRFRVEEHAGGGGMGEVYRALDTATGERVALKVMLAAHPELVERFGREARMLADLRHPAIVRYVAHGADDAVGAFLAMEWLDGIDLAALLARGPLDVDTTVALGRRTAEALAAAHAAGIVHRDVKPANLFLSGGEPGGLKVLDFGIARGLMGGRGLTATGALIGTPAYMAPEQARGEREIDARVDVYALGCVLFECLAGRPPFGGDHAMAVLGRVLFEPPPALVSERPGVPGWLAALVGAMLSKDRRARPADAAAVVAALGARPPSAEWSPLSNGGGAPKPPAPQVLGALAGEQTVASVVLVAAPARRQPELELEPTLGADEARQAQAALEVIAREHDASLEILRDGSMVVVVGGAGEATDRAVRAARCAQALRAALRDAPIAVATGRGDPSSSVGLGEVLDRAAALLALTSGADAPILVDATSAALLGLRFSIAPLEGAPLVDGAAAPGARLGAERADDDVRPLLGRRTRCVGRERDLDALVAHVDACADEGTARMVVVTAPPGVGKTRLRQELLARLGARSRSSPWVARADAERTLAPFGVIAGLVRSTAGIAEREAPNVAVRTLRARLARVLAGEALERAAFLLGEVLSLPAELPDEALLAAVRRDPKIAAEQTRKSWEEWLTAEAACGPVLLIVEDLHWADAASVDLLGHTLRAVGGLPIVVLGFARPEVRETFPALFAARDVHEHRLPDLGRRACEALVADVLGAGVDPTAASRIAERCAGNAFYLEELIRAAAAGSRDELPASVLAMVDRRIARLPIAARSVLRAASVLGERFHDGAVVALVDPSLAFDVAAELGRLAADELVVRRRDSRFAGHTEYAFRHALLRDGAYATLLDDHRRRAHALAARWIAAAGDEDAAVGEHHERAGEPAEAARCYVRAAHQAYARHDFDGALALLMRAEGLGASGLLLGELYAMRGKLLGARGAWADSDAALTAALPLLDGAPDAARADALVDAAYAAFWMQDSERIVQRGTLAVELSRSAGSADLETDALALVSLGHVALGDLAKGLSFLALARARSGGRYSRALAQGAMALYHAGRLDDVVALTRDYVAAARAARDTSTLVLVLANHGRALAGTGCYDLALAAFAEAQEVGEQAGAQALVARATSMAAGVYLDLDDLDGAETVARRAIALAAATGFMFPVVSARIDLLFVAARRADLAGADEHQSAVEVTRPSWKGAHDWLWNQRYCVAAAEADLARGDAARAIERASSALALAEPYERDKYCSLALQARARGHLALGDRAAAEADSRAATSLARALGDPALMRRAARSLLAVAPTDPSALEEADAATRRIARGLPDPAASAAFLARQRNDSP